ncbi:hypothetical protein BV898_12218 [Hypsibius exemplaris]|uniref:Uncharacterized protein n=1 Tax=Hypsibius exemplaris TaxID=2072580 RepID=A0A1W0WEE9_HYPEX|nr:hypothetical protein BV898_12218 [Hypsibius exemplaris]
MPCRHSGAPELFLFDVDFEKKLTTFPWEVLAPVAASLKYVSLSYNDKLANIDLSSSTATVALPMLEEITCKRNPALQTLPRSVLETLRFRNVTIEFTENGNVCDGCHTRALIDWVRVGPIVGNSRFLSTSCNSKNGSSNAFSGSTAQWLTHTDPNCDAVISSPTTIQTEPTMTQTMITTVAAGINNGSTTQSAGNNAPGLTAMNLAATLAFFNDALFKPAAAPLQARGKRKFTLADSFYAGTGQDYQHQNTVQKLEQAKLEQFR